MEKNYRLGGNWVLRVRLRSTGLKDSMIEGEGPGMWNEEEGSTSSESSVMPA